MNAFFQSAVNGSMQVKDGFLQVGEAEKQMFNNSNKNGLGINYHLSLLLVYCAHPSKVA